MRSDGFLSALNRASGRRIVRTRWKVSTRVQRSRNYTTTLETGPREITPLEQIILTSIRATGPIPVSSYMQLCLGHPVYGYYIKGDPLGVAGDFITSPEITQVFGELIAIWFISALQAMIPPNGASGTTGGHKRKLRLVELGPGRGTLSSDILRVLTGPLASRIGLPPVTNVHLVEMSPALRAKQEKTLERYTSAVSNSSNSHNPLSIEWHDHIDDIPVNDGDSTQTLVIANEFFDALPINIFEKAADGWHEVLVDEYTSPNVLIPNNPGGGIILGASDPRTAGPTSTLASPVHHPRLRFVLSKESVPVLALSTNKRFASLPVGTRVEYSRGSVGTMRSLARLIGGGDNEPQREQGTGRKIGGGLGLIIDYGAERFFSSSFRGFRNHEITDPFHQPGNSDLTANVDFATLKDAVEDFSNVCVHGAISQARFLVSMGLEARVAGLMRAAVAEEGRLSSSSSPSPSVMSKEVTTTTTMMMGKRRSEMIREGAMKLVDEGPVGMGKTFQVMALSSEGQDGAGPNGGADGGCGSSSASPLYPF
ncbi:hypothetical protein FRB91_001431 [Serendipita sp. 411]|nr:hypothetical protein FRB91_001431 [Serendipita sp. 411]